MKFEGHYNNWRITRFNKIVQIFGREFFLNKKILELGAGHGDNGKLFETLGSQVTFAEGNKDNFQKITSTNKILLDQDTNWNLNSKFDIIIHWGVLYHLNNWEQDLQCTLNHTNCVFLESEVCDSDDENFEIKTKESGYDQALNKIGSRPSANKIEKFLTNKGVRFTRHDDSDLNSEFHHYDWKVTNTKLWKQGQRRFWIVTK